MFAPVGTEPIRRKVGCRHIGETFVGFIQTHEETSELLSVLAYCEMCSSPLARAKRNRRKFDLPE